MKKNAYQKALIILCMLYVIVEILSVVSCSGPQSVAVLPEEVNTTKYATIKYSSECNWIDATDEAYKSVAQESLKKTQEITDSVIVGDFKKIVENVSIFSAEKIYPIIEGFGSLDTSNIPNELFIQINEFLNCIKTGEYSNLQVVSKKEYLRILAKYRLEKCKPLIKSYIGASEDVSTINNIIESIPVLIESTTKKYVLVLQYLKSDENKWQLNKFELYDWAITNENNIEIKK